MIDILKKCQKDRWEYVGASYWKIVIYQVNPVFRDREWFAEYREKLLLTRGPWHQAEIKQISRHGLILTTRAPVQEHKMLEIMMHLPAYRKPIKAAGKVLRTRRGKSNLEVSIEFTKLSDKDGDKLSESTYIKELIEKSDHKIL